MLTILAVDDEIENIEMMSRILNRAYSSNHQVLTSNISRAARDIVQTQPIDILLTDINMPYIDGFELCKMAKESNPKCHVIFLTGFNDFDYAYKALKAGCSDFILKINAATEITIAINKVIHQIEKDKKKEELLIEAERDKKLHIDDNSENEVIAHVKNYINSNIQNEITLYILSKAVHMNASYLSRIFKQNTGVTLTEYLLELRIKKAKELLRDTDLKVQEICLKVGIDSPAYFTRIFKKEVGCTTSEYRLRSSK